MFISADPARQNRQPLKTALVYLGASVLCFLLDKGYSLFAHGVSSPAMTWLFLYPLLGGSLVFSLLWLLKPSATTAPQYRAAYNLYNSGVATLAAGSLLTGIFDIAGTSSPYTVLFYTVGSVFLAAGGLAFGVWRKRMPQAHGI